MNLLSSVWIGSDCYFFQRFIAAIGAEKFIHDAGRFEASVAPENKRTQFFDYSSVQGYYIQADLF